MGIEYDLSHLSQAQRFFIKTLATGYMKKSYSFRSENPFDLWVWDVYQIKFIRTLIVIIDDDEDEDDDAIIVPVDELDFWSKLRLWWHKRKKKLEALGISASIITGISITIGVLILGLIGYQYTKSYVAEKGRKKA